MELANNRYKKARKRNNVYTFIASFRWQRHVSQSVVTHKKKEK